jgi:hypothetical protein
LPLDSAEERAMLVTALVAGGICKVWQ